MPRCVTSAPTEFGATISSACCSLQRPGHSDSREACVRSKANGQSLRNGRRMITPPQTIPHRALLLATALIRFAKLGLPAPQPAIVSSFVDGSDLAERVERLLREAPLPRKPGRPCRQGAPCAGKRGCTRYVFTGRGDALARISFRRSPTPRTIDRLIAVGNHLRDGNFIAHNEVRPLVVVPCA